VNEAFKSRSEEPTKMNRTFLSLLVVGLFIVVWHRNQSRPEAGPPTGAPAPGARPATAAPTNSTPEPSLVSFEQPIHK
jgi:hypothetical protein